MDELKAALEKLGFHVTTDEDCYAKRLVVKNDDTDVEFSFSKNPFYKPRIYARGDGMSGITTK